MFEKSIFSVVATLAPSILIRSSSCLEVTRIAITSRMSSNFSQIRPLTAELSALDSVKNQYFCVVATLGPSFLFGSSLFFKSNKDVHNILDEFEFRPDPTSDCRVICP